MVHTRLDQLLDYPFQRLAALLGDTPAGRQSEQPVPYNLTIGEPKHAVPDIVANTLRTTHETFGKYPPTSGTERLRAAIVAWFNRRYPAAAGQVDKDSMVLAVAGSREALYMAAQVALDPDRHAEKPYVLIPNPFYQVYRGAAMMAGGQVRPMHCAAANGFLPDILTQPTDVLAKTALVYLCSPGNPQGNVIDQDTYLKVLDLAAEHNFVVAADECYSEIYTSEPAPGIAEACAVHRNGFQNVLIFNSLSKRSSVPGLRSGFVIGDAALMADFIKLRAYGGATLPMPLQDVAACLWDDEQHVQENRTLYQQKLQYAAALFADVPDFRMPAGGFFLWLPVPARYMNASAAGVPAEAFAKDLWAQQGVRVIPGRYFSLPDASGASPGDHYVRVALVHDLPTTQNALQLMREMY